MNQQNIQPNLAAGFRNNAPPNPQLQMPRQPQQPMAPQRVNLQSVPPEILHSIRNQLLEEMNAPFVPQLPVDVQGGGDDSYSIFGFALQRKYVYIIACILLIVLGYYLWKWYTGKPSKQSKNNDDDEEESEYDEDLEFDGMLGYPDQGPQNKLMQQQIMQQQLMQQQMMQRKMAEQQAKEEKNKEE